MAPRRPSLCPSRLLRSGIGRRHPRPWAPRAFVQAGRRQRRRAASADLRRPPVHPDRHNRRHCRDPGPASLPDLRLRDRGKAARHAPAAACASPVRPLFPLASPGRGKGPAIRPDAPGRRRPRRRREPARDRGRAARPRCRAGPVARPQPEPSLEGAAAGRERPGDGRRRLSVASLGMTGGPGAPPICVLRCRIWRVSRADRCAGSTGAGAARCARVPERSGRQLIQVRRLRRCCGTSAAGIWIVLPAFAFRIRPLQLGLNLVVWSCRLGELEAGYN